MSVLKSSIILGVLILALFFGNYLKPTVQDRSHENRENFEQLIPKKFGDWKEQKKQYEVIKPPRLQASLDKIYSQIFEKVYVDSIGNEVMLSIAYGDNQSDAMRVHRPEGCYYGQGFSVSDPVETVLETSFGRLPVRTLIAIKSVRNEAITYWMKIGDKVVANPFDNKIVQLSYGLRGEIPDGLIFRVSSIGVKNEQEYKLQNNFINSFLDSLTPNGLKLFIGDIASNKNNAVNE